MVRRKTLSRKFAFLEGKVLGILLFGSRVQEKETPRSDIDICIVLGTRDPSVMRQIYASVWRKINVRRLDLDVKIFEELPLHIQINIIKHHEILRAQNKSALYEYFYGYRKRWNDQKHRQELTKDEREHLLRR